MEFIFLFATVCIIIGLWNLMIAILGLFPRFQVKTIGTLTKANVYRNVHGRHFIIPTLAQYIYTYTVKNKTYRYSGEIRSKRRFPPKTTLVYIKGFPRHAYPNKFKGTKEWGLGGFFLFMGILLFLTIMLS